MVTDSRIIEEDHRNFTISISGHSIAVHTMYTRAYAQCEKYLCDEAPEINISVSENDLIYEREEAEKAGGHYSDEYLETLAIYRMISEKMLMFNTFLMHGAVVAAGGDAYMFTARSGTGKTTHIKKWLENLKGSYVVNGDKPLIKITDEHALACGTPWCGKEQMGTNTMVPLKAIVFMERAATNEIDELSFSSAFTPLLQQAYWPMDADKRKLTLSLISQLKGKVRFYRFKFNNYKEDAFHVAYEALIVK